VILKKKMLVFRASTLKDSLKGAESLRKAPKKRKSDSKIPKRY